MSDDNAPMNNVPNPNDNDDGNNKDKNKNKRRNRSNRNKNKYRKRPRSQFEHFYFYLEPNQFIDEQYLDPNPNPNPSLTHSPQPPPPPPKKPQIQTQLTDNPYKHITPNIKTLQDLIDFGSKYNTDEYPNTYTYNINIQMINSMIPELQSLNQMVGMTNIKTQILDIILYWSLGLENSNQDFMHTVIEGDPGTGKTELAEKLSKIYLKMGILSNDIFKKVRRSDLVAGYLGQTAIKTTKVLEEVKGGVLFIDEAYSLGNAEGKNSTDSFSKECIDVLNQWLSENKNDFVCIIAGYSNDLANSFFSFNSGLERRFPIRFRIEPYGSKELGQIFVKKVLEFEWSICPTLSLENIQNVIEENKRYFKNNGGDMELLFAKCKVAHSKNLLKDELCVKNKRVIDKTDLIDGIKLFLLNPEIKKRGDISNSTYLQNTMYI